MFLADLMREVDLPVEVHFMAISRYGDAAESLGRVQILLDVDADLAGSRRDPGGGHRRHRAHASVTCCRFAAGSRTGVPRGVHPAGQGGSPDRAADAPVRRLRVPGPIRRGLRAGLRASATGTCPTSCRSTTSRRSRRDPDVLAPAAGDGVRQGAKGRLPDLQPPVTLDPTMIEMELTGVRVELPDQPADRAPARARRGAVPADLDRRRRRPPRSRCRCRGWSPRGP